MRNAKLKIRKGTIIYDTHFAGSLHQPERAGAGDIDGHGEFERGGKSQHRRGGQ
jgi:hypothetical protein